jgi:predicted Zn-dependent peptidase
MESPSSSNELAFAERVVDRDIGAARLLTLTTPIESVVSVYGAFSSYPSYSAGESLLQVLTVSLLDRGTKSRDRFEVAQILEEKGAKLNLFSDGIRIGFSAKALQKDVPGVFDVLADVLQNPLFDPEEFTKAKSRVTARLRRMMEDTSTQSDAALSRQIYSPNHPNYDADLQEELDRLKAYTVEDVRQYHEKHFGSNDLTLAAVGDLDVPALEQVVSSAFGDWRAHRTPPTFDTHPVERPAGTIVVQMADKTNIDVAMGHGLPVRRQDDDYIPLYLGNYILGGNFSARLMTSVRDDRGLTYGIGSGLSGISTEYRGHWAIHVTLSQDRLEEGVEATREQVRILLREGVTAEELEDKKTTLTGSFKVRLAKTSNLAEILLTNAERGFGLDYLDSYPRRIESTSQQEVNDAITRYLAPDDLHIAMAGSVPEEATVR